MRSALARAVGLAIFASVAAHASGCGGSGGGATPVPTLSRSTKVEAAFAPIERRWLHASSAERAALEREIDRFVRTFPSDPLARLGQAWLAWIALERGDLARAHAIARPIVGGSPGTTRDVALVVEGAALRRSGRPDEALRVLAPLVGKLVDAYARDRLDEEVVAAALAAGRNADALRFMEVWLRETTDDARPLVRAKVAAFVETLPDPTLLAIVQNRRAGADRDELEVPILAAQHLAVVADQRHDVELARRLLATGGPLLGERGEAVARLASGGSSARVDARTVGLLLSNADPASRRRGAQAAAGLAVGLGLPGSSARVVTREAPDEGAAAEEALSGLAADGAAVLVAGVNEAQARTAAAFASSHAIPVLLLRPAGVAPSRFVFALGEDPARVGQLLSAALLTRGAAKVAVVGDEAPSDASATKWWARCSEPLPVAAFREAGVQGIVVLGGPECGDDTARAVESGGLRARVALGLDASGSAPASGVDLRAVAGAAPFDAHTTNLGLRAWIGARGRAPTWFEALGRDAGVLAWEGVRSLPSQATEDPREVRARRAAVTDSVASAATELWTTEARGFDGARVLPRRVVVREGR